MRGQRRQVIGDFNGIIDVADMNQTVAVRARHVRIDLCHNPISNVDCRPRHVNGNAQRAKAVSVGGRDLNQGHFHRQNPLAKQRRNFAQKNWYVVRLARGDRRSQVRPNEQTMGAKAPRIFRPGIRRLTFGVQVDNLD